MPSLTIRRKPAKIAKPSLSPANRPVYDQLEEKMSPDDIRFLYDYNAWANRRSLDAAAPLTVEQFTRPLGSNFSSVRDTLPHIWGAVGFSMAGFEGRSPASLPDVGQFHEISALRKRWQDDEARLKKLASRVTQS